MSDKKEEEGLKDPLASATKEEELQDPFASKREDEVLKDPFASATKEEENKQDLFAMSDQKDPFASAAKEEKKMGDSNGKEEELNDPFKDEKEKELVDPFRTQKEEELQDPFASATKEENKQDLFAMSDKKEEEGLKDPFASVEKEEKKTDDSNGKEEELQDPFASKKEEEEGLQNPFASATKEEEMKDPTASKEGRKEDPVGKEEEEGLKDPFASVEKGESKQDLFTMSDKKEEELQDPFASATKEEKKMGDSKGKEEELNDPFKDEKELLDPFRTQKEEELQDPFVSATKEENKQDMFAMSDKKEDSADSAKTPEMKDLYKNEEQKELHDPFAAEQEGLVDPFSNPQQATTSNISQQNASPIVQPKLRPAPSPLGQSINSIFFTSNSPVIRRRSSLRTSSPQVQRSLHGQTPRRVLFPQSPAASLFDGLSSTPTSTGSLFTFDSVTPPRPTVSRLEKHEMLNLSTDDDYFSMAQHIGVPLTPITEQEVKRKPAQVVDVVSFFANDDEFSVDIEDGQRLRVIFDNMLPVVNNKPVLPDPEEMTEQVVRKAEALNVLLDSIRAGWGMNGKKKKLQRQVRSITEEVCVFEADSDICVCEKWRCDGCVTSRAMKKTRKIVEAKQKAFDAVSVTMDEVNRQKKALSDAIELRLKEYVDEKNARVEEMNREVDEFNVMYGEIEELCKQVDLTMEELLTEGKLHVCWNKQNSS